MHPFKIASSNIFASRTHTVWGGNLFQRFCKMFSESSPCLPGQHCSCSKAQQWPVEPSENILQNLRNKLLPLTVGKSENLPAGHHREQPFSNYFYLNDDHRKSGSHARPGADCEYAWRRSSKNLFLFAFIENHAQVWQTICLPPYSLWVLQQLPSQSVRFDIPAALSLGSISV